jgi:DNA-binding phage protein
VRPEYVATLAAALRDGLPAYRVALVGIIAVPKGLAMVGLPVGADVNAARASLRAALEERGLPFAEPYLNDIVHCTLLRLTGPLDAERTRRLLEIAEAHAPGRGPLLGTAEINDVVLNAASWRMHPSELAGGVVFPLRRP